MARENSELRAEFTATERRVVLVRGEAHFTVVKDSARPFVVSAGNASVRAVGTAFNVRFDPKRVEVLVTAGTVQVADIREKSVARPPLVTAGQRVVIEQVAAAVRAPVAVSAAASTEIEETLGWQSARLVFSRTPLSEAVAAFNRHSPSGPRLVIGDRSLRARRLGGSFRASNIEGFVRLLEQSADVRVERRGNQIVLWPAR
jgi:transmembrane sensor